MFCWNFSSLKLMDWCSEFWPALGLQLTLRLFYILFHMVMLSPLLGLTDFAPRRDSLTLLNEPTLRNLKTVYQLNQHQTGNVTFFPIAIVKIDPIVCSRRCRIYYKLISTQINLKWLLTSDAKYVYEFCNV